MDVVVGGRYRMLKDADGIGAGRSVYVALDQSTGEIVAIKRQPLPNVTAVKELAFFKALNTRHPRDGSSHVSPLNHYFTDSPHEVVFSSSSAAPVAPVHLYMVFEFMEPSRLVGERICDSLSQAGM